MAKCEEEIIQLGKWDKYFENPSLGTMRYLVFTRNDNKKNSGFEKCITKINGRVYIFPKKFFEWLQTKDLERT